MTLLSKPVASGLVQVEQPTHPGSPPEGEPEVWDGRVPAFNPLFARTPEPSHVVVSPLMAGGPFDVSDYLREERAKDLLRFSTAGSVDDGKSTLIGRLLYDTQSVYDDQLQSIAGKGTTDPGVLDLALLTDGLRAEREQGITIDVAYRYFSTPRRKFIIADTPGHEQYTRNMATGASTADVAIVLIDARKGVLPQSRRHAYITALLGVRQVIVAVNKMDLVGYQQSTFSSIQGAFTKFFTDLEIDGNAATELYFVPVSALAGDNVVHPTSAMPWYTGATLLDLLETIPSSEVAVAAPFRLAVQRVSRPNFGFRGFAGQIAAGTIRPGDRILALPSGRSSRVERIVTFDGDLSEASAPLSVTLTLRDEIDISRGDLLVAPDAPASVTTSFSASLVWMDETPLDPARRYQLKSASRSVQAQVRRVLHTVDLTELQLEPSSTLSMNAIGMVEIETLLPLAVDPYTSNRHTGSFVLIDPLSNATVAAGMIRQVWDSTPQSTGVVGVAESERIARFGHRGAHLHLSGPPSFAATVERALFSLGANVVVSRHEDAPALAAAGLLVITSAEPPPQSDLRTTLQATLEGHTTQIVTSSEKDFAQAVDATLQLLRNADVPRH